MKMWKFLVVAFAAAWKAIIAVFVAMGSLLKRVFSRMRGRKEKAKQEFSTTTSDEPVPLEADHHP